MQWRYWSTLDNAEHQKKKKAAFLSYKEIAVAWVVLAALVSHLLHLVNAA